MPGLIKSTLGHCFEEEIIFFGSSRLGPTDVETSLVCCLCAHAMCRERSHNEALNLHGSSNPNSNIEALKEGTATEQRFQGSSRAHLYAQADLQQ